jgi:citrate lyase beta subunit
MFLRINGLETPDLLRQDLDELVAAFPGQAVVDGLILPKVYTAGDIRIFEHLVAEAERRAGIRVGTLQFLVWSDLSSIQVPEIIGNLPALCSLSLKQALRCCKRMKSEAPHPVTSR